MKEKYELICNNGTVQIKLVFQNFTDCEKILVVSKGLE